MDDDKGCLNTDKEIWRKIPDDFYSPSIHVTESGGIGINVGGLVYVAPVEKWHSAIKEFDLYYRIKELEAEVERLKRCLDNRN